MRNVLITWKKELRGIFRDKKYLSIIFLMPLIIPMFIILMGNLYDTLDTNKGNTIGINYEMSEVEKQILSSVDENLEVKVDKDANSLQKQLDSGDINGYILKENDTYYIYIDTSSSDGLSLNSMLNVYFEQYNNYLANNYLVEHNINPDEVFNIVKVELKEQAKEGTNFFTNFLISFALIYLVMIITVTAMNTSTDIIAGEKERGTFETLLTFPITSNEIIGGKLMAIVISCILSSLIGISTSIPAFYIVKTQTKMFKTMSIDFSFTTILASILVLVLVSCLVGVISIFLCGKAKTFKEAQSKVSILSFFSMIPMFTGLLNVSSDILYMLPIANGGSVLNDLFLKGFDPRTYTLFVVSSLVVTIVVAAIVSSQYKDEKALF